MTPMHDSARRSPRGPLLAAVRAALALLTFVAIGIQLSIHVEARYSVLNFFSYFTNLSNLFAAGVLLLSAWDASTGRMAAHDRLRALSVVNMAIVGIVFSVLLRDVDLGALRPWINIVVHYVMPCAVVVDWVIQPPASRFGARQLGLILVFPLCYLVYVLLRGAATGWYPYPFLDPAQAAGYGSVAAYALGITATFVVVGALLLAIGNRLRRA